MVISTWRATRTTPSGSVTIRFPRMRLILYSKDRRLQAHLSSTLPPRFYALQGERKYKFAGVQFIAPAWGDDLCPRARFIAPLRITRKDVEPGSEVPQDVKGHF